MLNAKYESRSGAGTHHRTAIRVHDSSDYMNRFEIMIGPPISVLPYVAVG